MIGPSTTAWRGTALVAGLALMTLVVMVGLRPGDRPPTTADRPALAPVGRHVTLRTVGRVGPMPTALAQRSTTRDLWVATKGGRVYVLPAGRPGPPPEAEVVLDLRSSVDRSGDQGLLNLAFSPDGSRLYLLYTDRHRALRLVSRRVTSRRTLGPARSVLRIPMPNPGHQGGGLAWGPDGSLYVGIGDGWRRRQAQSPASLLGKVIRIRPRSTGPRPYVVPADNPLLGDPFARPEVWASGVRNPWRISHDDVTGRVWIGDVGESALEEVDVLPDHPGGANLGWPAYEGTGAGPVFAPGALASDPRLAGGELDAPDRKGFQRPWRQFRHGPGTCAVVGGFVYRGRALAGLVGDYVFTDVCDDGLRVVSLEATSPRAVAGSASGAYQRLVAGLGGMPLSLAEGADHELYVLLASGSIRQLVARP